MTPEQWDYFNWRCDNLTRMVSDLGGRVGQHDFAFNVVRWQNNEVPPQATAAWKHSNPPQHPFRRKLVKVKR